MAPLTREESWGSTSSIQNPELLLVNGEASESYSPVSPSKQDANRGERPIGTANRQTSHSLLLNSPNSSSSNRKSRFADPGMVGGNVERASLSMPPPATRPSSIYRPAASRQPHSQTNTFNVIENTSGPAMGLDGCRDQADSTPHEELPKAEIVPEPQSPSKVSDSSNLKPPSVLTKPGDRRSFTSLYSSGLPIYDKNSGMSSGPQSAASSSAGSIKGANLDFQSPTSLSPPVGSSKADIVSSATTATDPISVTAISKSEHQVSAYASRDAAGGNSRPLDSWNVGPMSRPSDSRRSRSKTKSQRQPSGSTAASSAGSPSNSDRGKPFPCGKVGVCALDTKARSKASRNILTRLSGNGEFEVIIFGDKVILDEDVENWPICDFMLSFFSDGFPLDKAIQYSNLRKPFCINDLPMQKILWDRRICLRVLDSLQVPTPKRIEINRDGGPTLESPELADHVYRFSGVKLEGAESGIGGGLPPPKNISLIDDGDTLQVDGETLQKPFVEKPVSGEDHNIYIYFPKGHESGGGGRRLFRKIGNKSSEWDKDLVVPRCLTENNSSYLYEKFLRVDNAEDIKAYTVGPDYCHAETRTSPVVDGIVRRNTHGKEIRYICNLTTAEKLYARKIATGFGQRVCGFDMLRVGEKSFVIDVNGWSFVKDNNAYYDQSASILKHMFIAERQKREGSETPIDGSAENPQTKDKINEESTISHRKSTHRSALKNLMKSPSMSKLRGHHPFGHHSHNVNAESAIAIPPLSSPPTFENDRTSNLHASIVGHKEQLPVLDASSQADAGAEIKESDAPQPASKHSWKLKGMVSVIRHADRTPKQKFKFTFHTQPFVNLLRGHQEEVLLKGEAALNSVMEAVRVAIKEGVEDQGKLQLLKTSLARKGAWTGTKVQIKPMFRKRKPEESSAGDSVDASITGQEINEEPEALPTSVPKTQTRHDSLTATTLSRYSAAENDLVIDKLQLIVKWGGEPTHSARYQSQDLGENMREDMLLMNKEALDHVSVFTSSERRVSTSAQIWAASFLNRNEVPESSIIVRKDLLDDSNAAKDVMDKVKKKLKLLLREGHKPDPQFAWPPNTPEPSEVVHRVTDLMRFHRKVMRYNLKKLDGGAAASLKAINAGSEQSPGPAAVSGSPAQAQTVASIQARWCCGEDPELFKERWEKLFAEFCDSEKVDPSKISELYDTMKFDALHNRQFLEWIFLPDLSMPDDAMETQTAEPLTVSAQILGSLNHERRFSGGDSVERSSDKSGGNFAHRMGLRRKSVLNPPSPQPDSSEEHPQSYFKLYGGTGQSKAKLDVRLEKLRELYKYAKVLFDFICPQEYGISDEEKLEIGLLTSLPLLKEIVHDLEEVQASEDAKCFIYFTKESHIYTLLNCILEGGIKTKIKRNAIPELDYLSNITFELYESEDRDTDTFTYSIRISITPGCHTFDPLDVQLDSKHCIGCAPRRSLTAHADWKEVIDTLRSKFGTVKLPKSFLAVNVSGDTSSTGTNDEGSEKGQDIQASP